MDHVEAETKVLARLFLLGSVRESVPFFSPHFWQPQALLGL